MAAAAGVELQRRRLKSAGAAVCRGKLQAPASLAPTGKSQPQKSEGNTFDSGEEIQLENERNASCKPNLIWLRPQQSKRFTCDILQEIQIVSWKVLSVHHQNSSVENLSTLFLTFCNL